MPNDNVYLRELNEIAFGELELEPADLEWPPSYGWMRRSEFDTDVAEAWERPDGRICGIRKSEL